MMAQDAVESTAPIIKAGSDIATATNGDRYGCEAKRGIGLPDIRAGE